MKDKIEQLMQYGIKITIKLTDGDRYIFRRNPEFLENRIFKGRQSDFVYGFDSCDDSTLTLYYFDGFSQNKHYKIIPYMQIIYIMY